MKMKFKDYMVVIVACTFALMFGLLISLPFILQLELLGSAINFLDRH